MSKPVELYNDTEFEQKYVLLQYASPHKRYEPGQTVGIKICGTFKSEEELEEKAKRLYASGQIYFPLETQRVGQWVSFPDYAQDTRKETEYYYKATTSFTGENVDFNQIMNEKKKNEEQRDIIREEEKSKLYQSTYLSEPETQKDLEILSGLTLVNTDKSLEDYKFYKEVLARDLENYKHAPEGIQMEETTQVNPEVDYLTILADPPSKQRFALFTFSHETTRQKSDSFCFKVRGAFPNMTTFEEHKYRLFRKDPVFDIYKVPIGEWVAFNSQKSNEEALVDLNAILGAEVVRQVIAKKRFEERVKNKKSEDYIWTKPDLQKSIDHCKERLIEITKDTEDYLTMFEYNQKKYEEKYNIGFEDEEVNKLYNEIVDKIKTVNFPTKKELLHKTISAKITEVVETEVVETEVVETEVVETEVVETEVVETFKPRSKGL